MHADDDPGSKNPRQVPPTSWVIIAQKKLTHILPVPASLSIFFSSLCPPHTHSLTLNNGQGLLYGNFQAAAEGELLAGHDNKAYRVLRGVCLKV